MRRHLLAGLVAIALMLIVLPGAVAAADGGNSQATRVCREDYADYGFKTRGACVSHLARGGTLEPTFQSICESLGGTYVERGVVLGFLSAAPGCEWAEIALSDLIAAWQVLKDLCTSPATYSQTSYTNGAVRCSEFLPG